jgi:MCP family monocarboxylic acid transporter-like MFS transporter 2
MSLSDGGPVGYTPPDGGWGWAVVAGAFVSIGFSCAFGKSISVFYKEIENIFNASTSEVSWISSIMFAVMYGGGEYPLWPALLTFSRQTKALC